MNAHPPPLPKRSFDRYSGKDWKKKKAAIYGTVSLHVYYINTEELMLAGPEWEFPIEINQIRL